MVSMYVQLRCFCFSATSLIVSFLLHVLQVRCSEFEKPIQTTVNSNHTKSNQTGLTEEKTNHNITLSKPEGQIRQNDCLRSRALKYFEM